MRSAAGFAESFKCPVLMLQGSAEHGSDAAIRLDGGAVASRRAERATRRDRR